MIATLSTPVFIAAALLAVAVIRVSLAKGFAAATMLRRQLILCRDVRTVTVRRERARACPVVMARPTRRPVRPAPALPARRRVAA